MKFVAFAALAALLHVSSTTEARGYPYHHNSISQAFGADVFYTNARGHSVHRPMTASARPSGATARCLDGSWSFSESHRGTCSHHGGVSRWL